MFSSHYDDALLSCSRRAAADAMRWRAGNAAERAYPSCPRCDSPNTKFCYYNNYSLSQPRYFCKGCRRYWTKGGSLRNVPVGGGSRRKTRRGHDFRRHTPPPQPPPPPPAAPPLRPDLLLHDDVANPAAHPAAAAACSSESSSCNQITPQPLIDEEILPNQADANFNGYSDLSVDLLPSTNGSNYLVHQGLEHINLGIINDEYWSSLDNYSSLIGGFL